MSPWGEDYQHLGEDCHRSDAHDEHCLASRGPELGEHEPNGTKAALSGMTAILGHAGKFSTSFTKHAP